MKSTTFCRKLPANALNHPSNMVSIPGFRANVDDDNPFARFRCRDPVVDHHGGREYEDHEQSDSIWVFGMDCPLIRDRSLQFCAGTASQL